MIPSKSVARSLASASMPLEACSLTQFSCVNTSASTSANSKSSSTMRTCRIIWTGPAMASRRELALNDFEQCVQYQRVRFLDARRVMVADDDFEVGPAFRLATVFAEERDRLHTALPGRVECAQDAR